MTWVDVRYAVAAPAGEAAPGAVTVGSTDVVYAIVPRCDEYKTAADVTIAGADFVTFAASHELLEAATDPLTTLGKPAYDHVDDAHVLWGTVFNTEVGDLCARGQRWDSATKEVGYAVQRMWSNSAAKAGRDPCVPAPGDVYFNAVPVLPEKVTLDGSDGSSSSGGQGSGAMGGESDEPSDAPPSNDVPASPRVDGITIAVGATKTIDVHLSSTAATSGPWTVSAMDWDNRKGTGEATLGFAFDRTSGKDGDTLRLSITAKTPGVHAFVLVSTLDNRSTYFPGVVVSQ